MDSYLFLVTVLALRSTALLRFREETCNSGLRILCCPLCDQFALGDPISPRMERIPPTSFAVPSAAARIVISETIQAQIPHRPVVVDHKPLGQGNPNRNNSHTPASEVANVQVVCFLYRLPMFTNPPPECWTVLINTLAFAPTRRHRLADVYGPLTGADGRIARQPASVEQGIDAGALNVVKRR